MTTTVAELCAGYGGLTLAIQQTLSNTELTWYAENDPDASSVMASNHPDTPNIGDVTSTEWCTLPQPNILAAGFPCQGFSMAGQRKGSADDRHLWPTGIHPAISALWPATVFLENVPGILAIEGGSVFRQVLTDLTSCGYTIRWTTLGACSVGACHCRHRLFVLATLAKRQAPDDVMFGVPLRGVRKWPAAGHVTDGVLWPETAVPCGKKKKRATLPTPTARDAIRGAWWGDRSGRPLSEVAAMLPTPGARLGTDRGQPSRELARSRINSGRRNLDDAVALLPTPRASDGRHGGPGQRGSSGDLTLPAAVQPRRWEQYAANMAAHARVTGVDAPAPTVLGSRGGQR